MEAQTKASSQSIWSVVGTDENYEWYRTRDTFKDLREWMDKACFEEGLLQYLDSNFLDQLRNHDFFARLWELELAEWLWLTKLEMTPTNGSGPDFLLEVGGKKVWIEAVLATPDETLVKIHQAMLDSDGLTDYPAHQMTLRYSSGLYTKATKIKSSYIDKGVISEDDIILIAISGFPPGALSPDIEHFQRAIIPMGDPVVHFSTDGSPLDESIPRSTHTSMPSQKKGNGATVLKQFLYPGDNFPFIDGVVFSESSNLQGLLGVSSSRFIDDSTNVPHIFPNYASRQVIPTQLTDNFYLHNFTDNPPLISLETIEPVRKLM